MEAIASRLEAIATSNKKLLATSSKELSKMFRSWIRTLKNYCKVYFMSDGDELLFSSRGHSESIPLEPLQTLC